MENGYKVLWTEKALSELEEISNYLKNRWPEVVTVNLKEAIDFTINLIEENPRLYPKSEKENIHKAVILKYNSLYYEIDEDEKSVIILSFFNNYKNPDKREL
ncbi:type II toxin-antitoxin system RelE/ParE family toxin [Marivirga tractuosa]|jgi:plasmid stabilization system protein ParE|uniref:type II toxin-antitoxin system RelE/ParE family toxin n=1 Tax=Marivirga tractuosa TaxID=1006 RepID=UPI0035CF5C02